LCRQSHKLLYLALTFPKTSGDLFFLDVDEFQNFATSSFATILSEARKYKLILTLAHQFRNRCRGIAESGDSQLAELHCANGLRR